MTDDGLPVVDPASLGPPTRVGPVVGVLLAAGEGERFGETNKLLAEIDGLPVVRHAARALVRSAVTRPTVVVGHEADHVRSALAGLPVAIVENPDYDRGQATSVRAGVEAARATDAAAVCFALGDMPWVAAASIDALVAAYRAEAGDALAAAVDGDRGNPVLFDARFFDALADVSGDTGGRELLLGGDASALVETGDPGVRRDVDEPEDLTRD